MSEKPLATEQDAKESSSIINPTKPKKKEIYTYHTPWTAYSLAWRRHPQGHFQFAVGSFIEEYTNQFQIMNLDKAANDGDGKFDKICQFDHPYPATKVMFAPSKFNPTGNTDLLATSGDYLRIWNLNAEQQVTMKGVLNNNKHSEYCAPLTSLDWNEADPSMVGVCSIDTTCTIWDINTMQAKTQLIAHDKEVYDISFAVGKYVFATVGADCSLRMFDLRTLEHSTILYETPDLSPLLKVEWNRSDPNYIAVMQADANKASIIDVRMPTYPIVELVGHEGALNGIAWAPHSSNHICTCGEDQQVLIWDISVKTGRCEDPILAFYGEGEINQLLWCSSHEDWVSICYNDNVQILKV